MASIRLSRFYWIGIALALTSAIAYSQAPARVRGTITAVDGAAFTVDGRTQVRLADTTQIVFAQPLALADIKPGDFVGVTSNKAQDGTLTAVEVRRFPGALNPGHRPFDGRNDQTMTNATVGSLVQSASGRDLVVTYPDGMQRITVPQNASVSDLVPGNRGQLVPGAPVNLTLDGSGMALRIQVGPTK
jgi:hypothetical protein